MRKNRKFWFSVSIWKKIKGRTNKRNKERLRESEAEKTGDIKPNYTPQTDSRFFNHIFYKFFQFINI